MAGDWIKMRGNLWDDPRISKICDITEQSEAAVVGGLYWLWATADQHTEDGVLPGLTLRQIDRKTGITGLGAALCDVGWLADHPEGVRITRFEEHNGASAKKRCQTAKRVANHKTGNAQVTRDALPNEQDSVSDALPREEKRREESKQPSLRSGCSDDLTTDTQPQKQKRAHQLPEDFVPDDAAVRLGMQTGVSLSAELPKFRDFHAARGKPMKDWQAAFRTWLRNAKAFARPEARQTKDDRQREWLRNLTGRDDDAINAPARLVG